MCVIFRVLLRTLGVLVLRKNAKTFLNGQKMKTLTLLVLTVITLYLCGGCMAQPSVEETRANLYQQWNGRPFKQVISKIGLPKQQMPDGSGGTIYSYSETQTFQAPSQIYTSPSTNKQGLLSRGIALLSLRLSPQQLTDRQR
jgi:hypothetical protein